MDILSKFTDLHLLQDVWSHSTKVYGDAKAGLGKFVLTLGWRHAREEGDLAPGNGQSG